MLSRKWETVKLILAIATGQHRPAEPKEKYGIKKITLSGWLFLMYPTSRL